MRPKRRIRICQTVAFQAKIIQIRKIKYNKTNKNQANGEAEEKPIQDDNSCDPRKYSWSQGQTTTFPELCPTSNMGTDCVIKRVAWRHL